MYKAHDTFLPSSFQDWLKFQIRSDLNLRTISLQIHFKIFPELKFLECIYFTVNLIYNWETLITLSQIGKMEKSILMEFLQKYLWAVLYLS
jgi:hypothetical protein